MPKISVVIPVYNRGNFVRESIDSVLTQTFQDFEVIAIDDGSTDHSLSVLQSYGSKIKVLTQVNQGQGIARNFGIEHARGDFIAFLDSDDLWEPSKLKRQIDSLDASNSAWIYSDAYIFENSPENVIRLISDQSSQFSGDIAQQLLLKDFIVTSSVMVQGEVFQTTGLFTAAPKAEDWDLWLRIASRYSIEHIPECLVGYRLHPSMISTAQSPLDALHYHIQAINHAVAFAPEIYQPVYKKSLALQYIRAGNALAAIGELMHARAMYQKSLTYQPLNFSALFRWTATFLGKRFVMNRIAKNRANLKLKKR